MSVLGHLGQGPLILTKTLFRAVQSNGECYMTCVLRLWKIAQPFWLLAGFFAYETVRLFSLVLGHFGDPRSTYKLAECHFSLDCQIYFKYFRTHFQLAWNVVWDQNLVSISGTETKIFWYRFRSQNVFVKILTQ